MTTPRRPTVTEAPRPIDVRHVLEADGIASRGLEIRDAIDAPGALLVRVRNPRDNTTAGRVRRALDAAGYRLELPAAAGVYLVRLPADPSTAPTAPAARVELAERAEEARGKLRAEPSPAPPAPPRLTSVPAGYELAAIDSAGIIVGRVEVDGWNLRHGADAVHVGDQLMRAIERTEAARTLQAGPRRP